MHKMSSKELGPFRLDLMTILASSPDPFAFIKYDLEAGPCKQLAKELSLKTSRKITLTHVLNKLLGLAIAENPLFNQVILGSSVYQMEQITISNAFLIPSSEHAVTYILLEDPHLKSLEVIQQEFTMLREKKIKNFARSQNPRVAFLKRLFLKMKLFKLIGEKKLFTMALERGFASNIVLLNHVYNKPATFIVIKPIITPVKVSVRIHAHGAVKQTFIENGTVKNKQIIPLHIAIDHRIIHGVHAHWFGESLERIASNPEKYLL